MCVPNLQNFTEPMAPRVTFRQLKKFIRMVLSSGRKVKSRPSAIIRENRPQISPALWILHGVLTENHSHRIRPNHRIEVFTPDNLKNRAGLILQFHLGIIWFSCEQRLWKMIEKSKTVTIHSVPYDLTTLSELRKNIEITPDFFVHGLGDDIDPGFILPTSSMPNRHESIILF